MTAFAKVSENIKNNNFDFLRFVFASLVVISHAYPLSGSSESFQWISILTNGQVNFASIGLNGFFVISGYFIFQSLQRSSSVLDYFKKRILRIFPALLVMLLLILLFVPFVFEGNESIFKQYDYYTYLPKNLSLYLFQAKIQGVFDKNYYHAINGSLWTIRYEFSLYIFLSLLFYLRAKKAILFAFLLMSFASMYLIYVLFINYVGEFKVLNLQGYHLFNLGTFFMAGCLLSSVNFQKVVNKKLLLGAVIICIIAVYFQVYDFIKHLLFPIVILGIGFIPLPFFSTFGKYGDMSYGIYIYSFPIQQILVYFFQFKVNLLLLTSLSISIILGYLSWHLIEKKALRLKKKQDTNHTN